MKQSYKDRVAKRKREKTEADAMEAEFDDVRRLKALDDKAAARAKAALERTPRPGTRICTPGGARARKPTPGGLGPPGLGGFT